jgi:hypothetical protein
LLQGLHLTFLRCEITNLYQHHDITGLWILEAIEFTSVAHLTGASEKSKDAQTQAEPTCACGSQLSKSIYLNFLVFPSRALTYVSGLLGWNM